MNDDKRISDDYFEFMLKRAAKNISEDEGEKYIDMLDKIEEPALSSNYKNHIDKLLKTNIYKTKSNARYIFKTVAVFVVGVGIAITTAYNADANFRLFVNKWITVGDGHIDISNNISEQEYDLSEVPDNWEYIYLPQYIPNGYKVISIEPDYFGILIEYSNDKDYIYFYQENNLNASMSIDTDHTDISDIKVGNYDGIYLLSDNRGQIMWDNREYYFSISGEISKEELLKIAESLKIMDR